MAEVLVRQLQQVLAPWDQLSQSGGHRSRQPGAAASTEAVEPTLDNWATASSQEALAHARAATTRLELSRAAVALFTSNAGAFRPLLVKVFRFLFDHVDELRDEVAQLTLEALQWRQGEAARTAAAASGAGPSSALGGATAEEQNAVVSAYEKVRQTESRMAALVEEASVQRDHLKSQVEAQRKERYHLEDLLQHQMELRQTLLDDHLQKELVGGAPDGSGQGTTAVGEAMVSGGGGHGKHDAAASAARVSSVTAGAGGDKDSRRGPAERRDAAYVQRLIARADRELALETAETQVRELRATQTELESKVQSLLKLNSKYARQCMELSARLSIIHENNIALAADVQLFQRDHVKEQQRSANLQHALQVARGIVLTTLQVQSGVRAGEIMDKVSMLDTATSQGSGGGKHAGDAQRTDAEYPVLVGRTHALKSKAAKTAKGSEEPSSTTPTATAKAAHPSPPGTPVLPPLDAADRVAEALRAIADADLRAQLQDLLQLDDVEYGGRVKIALLRLLDAQVQLSASAIAEAGSAAVTPPGARTSAGVGQSDLHLLPAPCLRAWAPPYGLRRSVPRHLRSAAAVPLVALHPLLAEAIVHELLSQRLDLLAFAQAQLRRIHADTNRSAAGAAILPSVDAATKNATASMDAAPSPAAAAAAVAAQATMQQLGAVASLGSFLSFPAFIELFVLVNWLNRADRYLPLLPDAERTRLEEEAEVRAEAHARRMSRLIAAAPARGGAGGKQSLFLAPRAAGAHTTLWELRHVLHLVRPAAEHTELPPGGLQLTYALDAASQQRGAGALTYAYGLTSRQQLCEILFAVLRAEREALLAVCRAIDAALAREARAAVAPITPTEYDAAPAEGPAASAAKPPGPAAGHAAGLPGEAAPLRGWVPTVEFVRLLLAMFPGYAPVQLEQLIAAAVADGTEPAESPATLFYEALLPARMLPGPTAATTTADSTVAAGTRFAALFYGAICDDALESMQLVEDSVFAFAQSLRRGPEGTRDAASAGDAEGTISAAATATATAPQITANAFLGLPRAESQQWVAGLRSVVQRWPRLRATAADPTAASAAERTGGEERVSATARVGVEEVVPYLRTNVIVRRGHFPHADSAAAAADTQGGGGGGAGNEQLPPSPTSPLSGARASGDAWSPTQQRLLQRWEAQWAQYGSGPSTAGGAAAPSGMQRYVALLQQLEPYRARPWASETLSRENPLLHPVHFEGSAAVTAEMERHDAANAAGGAAAPRAAKKTGKKLGKRPAPVR